MQHKSKGQKKKKKKNSRKVGDCIAKYIKWKSIRIIRLWMDWIMGYWGLKFDSIPSYRLGELFLVLFVRLFDLCLFGFVGFLLLLVSWKGCGLWLWHSLDFSFTFFFEYVIYYGTPLIFLLIWYVCSTCACLVLPVSSSSWCLAMAVVCDCGTPWTFLLHIFSYMTGFSFILCSSSQFVLVPLKDCVSWLHISWVSSLIFLCIVYYDLFALPFGVHW